MVLTSVTLADFAATPRAGEVALRWRTAQERDALGFHVWRSSGGAWKRVDARLIPAQGSLRGHTYGFVDRGVRPGTYRYRLELVGLKGRSTSGVRTVTVARAR